jgi:hypothetical protein
MEGHYAHVPRADRARPRRKSDLFGHISPMFFAQRGAIHCSCAI